MTTPTAGTATIALAVRTLVAAGMDPRDALDAVLGPGTARALIHEVYTTLRARTEA